MRREARMGMEVGGGMYTQFLKGRETLDINSINTPSDTFQENRVCPLVCSPEVMYRYLYVYV